MKLLFFTRYDSMGASSRYRAFQYLPYLKDQGISITVSPLFNSEYLQHRYATKGYAFNKIFLAFLRRFKALLSVRQYDLVFVEKEFFPYFPAWVERWLNWRGVKYVVDYDDAIFHNYDLHPRWLVRFLLGNKIKTVMKASACVVAGNAYLAQYAKQAGANRVEIVPTVIDLSKYLLASAKKEEGLFTIGWIGTPYTVKYLKTIESALQQLSREGNVRLMVIGATDAGLSDVDVVYVPWSSEKEVENMQLFDVGIMPLLDSPWEKGKCGFKLIQYMACGLPVVASPVGVNREIVDEQYNGFLASSTQEWVEVFTRLKQDKQLRQQMGDKGRTKVEQQYALQVTAPKLASLFSSLVKKAN